MQTIQLGTMDLYGYAYGPFTPTGGYFDIKQDGATSLRTGARKGDPKGFSLKFSVCFQTEAEASAFLAYVAPFDPDAPDFDEEVGADIPLYIRDADWHYNVHSVVIKPEQISKEVLDYIQYQYEVICYCYSPYSEAATTQTFPTALKFYSYNFPTKWICHVNYYGEISDVVTGANREFYVRPGLSDPTGVSFESVSWPGFYLIHSNYRILLYEITASNFAAVAANATFLCVAGLADADALSFQSINFPTYYIGHCAYHLYIMTGAGPADCTFWPEPDVAVVSTMSLDNATGHLDGSPDMSAESGATRPASITVVIADSKTLILATQANSAETWELVGNENKLLQTYEDAITAGTQWGRDWVGDGTFDTDHMELDNGESAYIILSGPHQAKKPIKMTADLSLDSGGATGEATVDISPDGVAWQTVLDQDDFEAGSAEYPLAETYAMTDIYVRISCNSGTSGKKVNIGSIKFEVERWIEDGAVPVVAAGATKALTVSATGGAIAVSGSFAPRRKFL